MVGRIGDGVGHLNQLTQYRAFANNGSVRFDVGRAGGVCDQRAHIVDAANVIQLALFVEPFRQSHYIERTALFGQKLDGTEDQPVVAPIEIGIRDNIAHFVPGTIVEHQSTQYGLLRLDGVWGYLEGLGSLVAIQGDQVILHGHPFL